LRTLNPNEQETYYHALQSSQGYLKPNLILHTHHGKQPHESCTHPNYQSFTKLEPNHHHEKFPVAQHSSIKHLKENKERVKLPLPHVVAFTLSSSLGYNLHLPLSFFSFYPKT